jgi:hypothetical protein
MNESEWKPTVKNATGNWKLIFQSQRSDLAIYVQLDDDGRAATGKQLILERFPDKATEFDWKLKSAG